MKKKVEYIRNCVEEVTGEMGDHKYNQVYTESMKAKVSTMQDRINAIIRAKPRKG